MLLWIILIVRYFPDFCFSIIEDIIRLASLHLIKLLLSSNSLISSKMWGNLSHISCMMELSKLQSQKIWQVLSKRFKWFPKDSENKLSRKRKCRDKYNQKNKHKNDQMMSQNILENAKIVLNGSCCKKCCFTNAELHLSQGCRKVGAGGGALAPPIFGRSANPILTRGDTLSPPSTTSPPGISDLATALVSVVTILNLHLCFWK